MGEFSDAIPLGAGARPAHEDSGGLKRASRGRRRGAYPVLARLRAVLATYPRRWQFRVCAVLLLAYLLAVVAIPRDADGRPWMLLAQLTAVEAIFAAMMTDHAKEQLLDARAAVTPHYRGVHLGAWLALMVAVLLALPLASARLYGPDIKGGVLAQPMSPLGAAAFAGLWAMALAWSGHFASVWTLVPIAGMFSLLGSAAVRAQLLDVLAGRAPGTALGMLLVMIGLLALLAWRFVVADEHSIDWRRAMTNWGLRATMTGDPSLAAPAERPGREAGPIATFSSRFDWLLRYTGRSLYREPPGALFGAHWWWRVRQYRMVTLAAWRPAALALVVVLVFTTLAMVVALSASPSPNEVSPWQNRIGPAMAVVAFCVTIMPGVIVGFLWPKRWLTISYEAMLPSTRRQFIFETGAAMLLDQLSLWLVSQLATWFIFVIAFFVARRDESLGAGANEVDLFRIALVVGAMLAVPVLIFGVLTAVMWVRSALLSFFAVFLIAATPFIPIMIAQMAANGRGDEWDLFLGYLVALLLGVVSVVVGYCLWRNADFD